MGTSPNLVVVMGKKARDAGKKKNKGGGDGTVSETVQKEFMAHQEKITKAAIQLENLAERKDKNQRELRRAAMTVKAIQDVDDEVPLFRQYGKMFIGQQKRDEIIESFTESAAKSTKEVKTIDDTMAYFEKQRGEAETNLREMMGQLEAQMQASA